MRGVGASPTCPICQAQRWTVGPVTVSPYLKTALDPVKYQVPFVSLVCENCFYVMQFAWKRVRDKVERGE